MKPIFVHSHYPQGNEREVIKMGFSVSSPTYMYQSPSGYIFRMRIPNDLRAIVGKGEFRYSLRTGISRIAKYRANCIATYLRQLFMNIRTNVIHFTKEKIQSLVKEYIGDTLAKDEYCRFQPSKTLDATFSKKEKVPEENEIFILVRKLLHSMECFASNNHPLKVNVQNILQQVKLLVSGELVEEELTSSLKKPRYTFQGSSISLNASKSGNFSGVQENYILEVEKGGNWTEKTKAENLSIFALFMRVVGDLPVDQIDRKVMTEYKSILMELPPNLNKGAKYEGKTIAEIIESHPEKTITVSTINKYIRRLSGLFNYAVRNGYMQSNPAEGMQIKSQKRADQERSNYTKDDLRKLFSSDEYKSGKHRHSYAFWTPLIALYTGCRLEEICQLHLEDIIQKQGVWVFEINDKGEKRLKNRSSERLIPIHHHLVELGLLDHVNSLVDKGEQRLFPELQKRRDGYGQTVSKWFQRYKKRCGIIGAKTFHSFRHTFITHLKHKQVDPYMIHELDGHAIDSETMGRYGKRYPPAILLENAVQLIDYGIDFRRLKWKPMEIKDDE